MHDERIVLYDGYCNLCSRTVQWIVRNDPKKQFDFKPLQQQKSYVWPGENSKGSAIIDDSVVLHIDDSVVLLMEGKVYKRSTAVLKIAVRLRFPWPLTGLFFLMPIFLRDPIYNVVARNRKRWFGERTTCYIN